MRVASVAVCVGLVLGGGAVARDLPPLAPHITPLDLHPTDVKREYGQDAKVSMPQIVRPDNTAAPPEGSLVPIPVATKAAVNQVLGEGPAADRGGTGFFVASDGQVLTAAHVIDGCSRLQVISALVPRTWVSVDSVDPEHDLALLRTAGVAAPAVLRISASPPVSGSLHVFGFTAAVPNLVPVEATAVTINHKFPASVSALANPRSTVWLSAPAITHGFSGGPIIDTKLGAVVGVVRGSVDAGFLRLVRDVPTTGVAIGPGISEISALLRRIPLYAPASDAGIDESARRATVRVLCWK